MNRLRFIFISVVVLLTSGRAAAYDFESGGLYYNILDADAKTVEVTLEGEMNYWDTQSSYIGSIDIPATVRNGSEIYSVKKIGQYAFCRSEITSLTIQYGIEAIDECAFLVCTQLKDVSLPSSLTSIGNSAFFNCYQITELVIPEGVSKIDGQAFCYCGGMKTLQLPSTLTEIGDRAFGCCGSLTKVKSNILTPFAISNATFSSDESWNNGVNNPIPSSAYLIVPQGAKSAYMTYEGWTRFVGIYEGEPQETTLPDGLKYSYITDERIATVIGWENLDSEDLTIRSIVEINGENYNVKSVGPNAFSDCGIIRSLTFEDGIETIGNYAFRWCYNLRSISFSSTIKKLNVGAFQSCNQLSSLTIPEGVQVLEDWAFSDCNKLSKVELPSSLTSMGNGVFGYCSSLYAVISHIQTPFYINQNVFACEEKWNEQEQKYYYTPSSATLYVPTGTKPNYEALEGWNMFAGIVEGELKEETIDGIIYSYNSSTMTATVVGSDFSEQRNITIPGSVLINGIDYVVKNIKGGAFYNNNYIDSLYISSGIETIEKGAFQECFNMRYMELPSTIITIGENAFRNCDGLRKVVLPSSLTSLGEYAFALCQNLSSVVSRIQVPLEIGQNVFNIGWYWDENNNQVFYKTNATLYVPIGTKSAYEAIEGWNMFVDIIEGEIKQTTYGGLNYSYIEGKGEATVISGDYSQITNLTIPGSIEVDGVSYIVKAIDNNAFNNYGNIDTLTIEPGVESIGRNAFYYCYNMKSISLPTTLTSIGEFSFAECYNLTSLVIPEGVKTVGQFAFSWCYSIKQLELPSTLDSIGDYAFQRCSNMSRVVSRIKTPFKISKSVFCTEDYWENDAQVFRNSPATLYVLVGTKSAYEAYEGWNMFDGGIYEGDPKEGKSGIFSYIYMTDSKTATIVGVDYTDQRVLEIPATAVIDGNSYNVVGIGNEVFSNKSLISVTIPSGVETIGKRTFYECYDLRSVKLPETITSIGDEVFQNCNVLDTISIPSNIKSIGYNAFWATKITEVKIPATTTYIGNNAFAYCEQLKSISVDANNSAYDSRNNCNALIDKATNTLMKGCGKTVIPNSVVTIGTFAFSGCKSLTGVSIPNSVTSIANDAFAQCDALTALNIPSSVSTIENNAFWRCPALTSIHVDANNRVFDSRNECNALIETATNTILLGCQSTVIPRTVKAIGQNAFYECQHLDSVKIPHGVTSIGYHAFYNCADLLYVEIPNGITYISGGAFEECYNLTTIVSKIKDPSFSNEWPFGSSYSYATLYVPKGKLEEYKRATGWSDFQSIVEMDGDPAATPTLSYNGCYVTASSTDKDVELYWSADGTEPSNYYEGPFAVHDLGSVKVIAEKSMCADSEPAELEITYLYDGEYLKQKEAGHMADAIKWCSTDSIEKMTVDGPINSTEFETIRTLSSLKFLNLAAAKIDGASLPDGAFANSQIVSFVSPSSLSSVGSGIFRDCQQLAAVCWKASTPLPADALSGVSNPNLLLYVSEKEQTPAGINNVVVDGVAKSITLTDATGNCNFYVPVAFEVTDSITYTRNFQQKTEVGVSRGWETIVLPFNVQSIKHEKNGTLTPFANTYGGDSRKPFWLYTLNQDNISAANNIEANVPYLICMPNADEYGDQYNLAGNVTFKASNVVVGVSNPVEKSQYDITFVPTYQSVPASADVFALNVNQEYKGYPAGSLFVNNFREVRPFEAYSVHPSAAEKVAASRVMTVASLIGGDEETTGIIDVMLKKNDGANGNAVVRVYSLSGALVKQGKAEDVTKGLPKGIYIANGKKFVVR